MQSLPYPNEVNTWKENVKVLLYISNFQEFLAKSLHLDNLILK